MLITFPKEIIYEIIDFIDIKTLITIAKTGLLPLDKEEIYEELCIKLNMDVTDYTLDGIELIIVPEYIVFLLTTLGKGYHTGFGIKNWNGPYFELSRDEDNSLLTEFIDDFAVKDEECQDEELAYFDYDVIENFITMFLPFQTVILQYPKGYWRQKPDTEWYNSKSTWWKNERCTNELLPFLNTRPYITVDDPYMQVTISAEKKGSSITIDDVLFATRALACDDTRTVADDEGYTIISKDDKTLTLQPCMDNYST